MPDLGTSRAISPPSRAHIGEQRENFESPMLPLYAVHLRDLGPGDRVQISCLVCEHTGLLTADFLLRLGLDRHDKVLDLQRRMRCRGCEFEVEP
jgi:hypothetical protein